jgi:UDP:flavonoid glycosyltransferase YjiC (YdhE family)
MNPSYPIVFYVSGHGFGHASRTIEVIHAVLRRRPDTAIVVKTSAPRRLFERALGHQIEIVELSCDTGMVQIDSLHIDEAESIKQARAFQAELPQKAVDEAAFLRRAGARLVVGDIPPLAFAAAAGAGVPSVAIGNFTWDWIYEGYPEQSPFELAAQVRSIYQQADRALRLPTAGGFAGLERITRDIPFVARQSLRDPDDVRRAIGLPPRAGDRPLVLMSFGGYGLAGLDSRALDALGDYRIATTDLPARDHSIQPAPGLLYLSEERLYANGYRYEDLVRAADVVVTKPGYGIISESIANDTALLYTSRGRFVEYEVLVKEMPRYLRAQFIDQDDLLKGNWAPALEALLNQPAPPEAPALNGADVAADEILRLG